MTSDWRDEWDFLLQVSKDYLPRAELIEKLEDRKLKLETFKTWLRPCAGLLNEKTPVGNQLMLGVLNSCVGRLCSPQQIREARDKFFEKKTFTAAADHFFVGREAELTKLRQMLTDIKLERRKPSTPNPPICLSPATIHGSGGQGKTAIARQFALSFQNDYAATIWIDASSGSIDSKMQKAAQVLPIPIPQIPKGLRDPLKLAFLRLAAAYRGKILLILDDLPAQESARSELVVRDLVLAIPTPLRYRFQMLLTCRRALNLAIPKRRVKPGQESPDRPVGENIEGDREEYVKIQTLQIRHLNEFDALALFKQRADWQAARGSDEDLRRLVAERLGGHSLSITLVAGYARSHPLATAANLITLLQGKIVDADESLLTQAKDYTLSLYSSFKLSFDAQEPLAQKVLLMLGLFRRSRITTLTVKRCARGMRPRTAVVGQIRGDLGRTSGISASLNALFRHSLLEKVEAVERGVKSAPLDQIRLHEVIYDFAQEEWARLRGKGEHGEWLHDLECCVTESAVEYASGAIAQNRFQFADVETLTGLLLPIVNRPRGFVPSLTRISTALDFWWENIKFQDYVYATGLQELLLAQINPLQAELREAGYLEQNPKHELILSKLIGHAYYADPKNTGHLAETAFDNALKIMERPNLAIFDAESSTPARIYRIFLLDHLTNVRSNHRSPDAARTPVTEDMRFSADIAKIESLLPTGLTTLDDIPSPTDYYFLVRAMHYWGHRGNQDSFTLLRQFASGAIDDAWHALARRTLESYLKALSYRMLAIRVFRSEQYNRWVAKLWRNGKLSFYPDWVHAAPAIERHDGYEGFTSLAQAFGDTAHQYCCIHRVTTLQYIARPENAADLDAIYGTTQKAHLGAKTLWSLSQKALTPGETPLKFQIWMACSAVFAQLLDRLQSGGPLPRLEDAKLWLNERIEELQEQIQAPYVHGAEQQLNEVTVVWEGLARRRMGLSA